MEKNPNEKLLKSFHGKTPKKKTMRASAKPMMIQQMPYKGR